MENILLFISDGISRIKYVFLKDEISLELIMLNYQKKQILSRTKTFIPVETNAKFYLITNIEHI
jgi:hypothetical protein